MFVVLVVLFAVGPFIEVAIFIAVGREIGIVSTIGLCLLFAVLGALIVRRQGLATFARVQSELRAGHVPAMELAEGAAIFAAGALLITPGFFSDAVGFVLLIPMARRAIIRLLIHHFSKRLILMQERAGPPGNGDHGRHVTIDGEAEEINKEDAAGRDSPWRK